MASQLANDIIGLLKDSCEQIKNLKEENGKLKSENRKLRYERQMAKAAYFKNLSMVKDYEARELFDCGCDKSADKKLDDCNKCYDIAAAYEARAKKLKEEM